MHEEMNNRVLRSLVVSLLVGAFFGAIFFTSRSTKEPLQGISSDADFGHSRNVQNENAPDVPFSNVAVSSGVDFRHSNGAQGELLMPELFGSGCAFIDFDQDHDQDLLLLNSNYWPDEASDTSTNEKSPPSIVLCMNDGSGRFSEVTSESGLNPRLYGMGVGLGDYNDDGMVDIFVTSLGTNILYRNRGDGTFESVSELPGQSGQTNAWSTSCTWMDYDNDSDLDLFVCTYVSWSRSSDKAMPHTMRGVPTYLPPGAFDGTACLLYRNNSDNTFSDVSEAAGISVTDLTTGKLLSKALGVCSLDVDQDGWMDIVVANDQVAGFYFHNLQNGTFEEIAVSTGLAFDRSGIAIAGMGIDAAVVTDGDDLAIAVGNISNRLTAFYQSDDSGKYFQDVSGLDGLMSDTRPVTTFGLLFFDCDLDGRLDLFHANGSINTPAGSAVEGMQFRQPCQLFWNESAETNRFRLLPREKCGDAIWKPIVGRGAAVGDLDDDGDLDLLVTENNGPVLLLRNDQKTGHHWLRLKLIGRYANRDAVGTRVSVRVGGVVRTTIVSAGRSYLSQCESPVTIGIGRHTQVEQLTIHWPDGSNQQVEDIAIDQLMVIRQFTESPIAVDVP